MGARTIALASAAALSTAVLAVGSAVPASADDNAASWSKGFPSGKDAGASLGAFEAKPLLDIAPLTDRWYVCADLKAKAGTDIAEATYSSKPLSPRSLTATARVYASPAKAKSAFHAITKGISACAGTRIVVSEPGSSDKWKVVTTTGEAPDATIDGTPSVYTYSQSTPAKGSSAKPKTSTAIYQLLSLEGDAILVTEATLDAVSKFTPAQQAAVAAFAGDFAQTWAKAAN